jgi:hypothetical protein
VKQFAHSPHLPQRVSRSLSAEESAGDQKHVKVDQKIGNSVRWLYLGKRVILPQLLHEYTSVINASQRSSSGVGCEPPIGNILFASSLPHIEHGG